MSAEHPHLFPPELDPAEAERHRHRLAPAALELVAAAVVVAAGGAALALHGRALFARTCATCHTLAAANAVGKVGSDLDPTGLLSGADATAVAAFVSAVTRDRVAIVTREGPA